MESPKLSLTKWGILCYLILTARKRISSLQLSKELGITQKSAWFMLQRIREACKQGDFVLSNVVEVDEAYIDGLETNKHESNKLRSRRGTVGKTCVLGMRERGGRTKAKVIQNRDKETLEREVRENVAKGSVVYTDEHKGYTGLMDKDFEHRTVNHSVKEFVNMMASTNSIESVWTVVKRVLLVSIIVGV